MKQGEIYLVNFGKKYNSEFGKVRPAVIIQNDVANRNIDKVDFKSITIAPLTTQLFEGNIRVRIEARDKLKKTSDVCVNELCTLDIKRFDFSMCLTQLTNEEMMQLKQKLKVHLSL